MLDVERIPWVSNLVERNLLSLKRLDICIYLSHLRNFLQQKNEKKMQDVLDFSFQLSASCSFFWFFFARLLPHPTGKVGFCWLEISATDMRFCRMSPMTQHTPLRFFWISCSSAQHDENLQNAGKTCRWKWWKRSKLWWFLLALRSLKVDLTWLDSKLLYPDKFKCTLVNQRSPWQLASQPVRARHTVDAPLAGCERAAGHPWGQRISPAVTGADVWQQGEWAKALAGDEKLRAGR